MSVVVIVCVAGFVLVLDFGLLLIGVAVLVSVAVFVGMTVVWRCGRWILFSELRAIVDVDLCGGDSAAIDLFDRECRVEIEGGDGFVEDLWIYSGVDECSEKHIAADAGKAVEVSDAHEKHCFMFRCACLTRAADGRGGKKRVVHGARAVAFGVEGYV